MSHVHLVVLVRLSWDNIACSFNLLSTVEFVLTPPTERETHCSRTVAVLYICYCSWSAEKDVC